MQYIYIYTYIYIYMYIYVYIYICIYIYIYIHRGRGVVSATLAVAEPLTKTSGSLPVPQAPARLEPHRWEAEPGKGWLIKTSKLNARTQGPCHLLWIEHRDAWVHAGVPPNVGNCATPVFHANIWNPRATPTRERAVGASQGLKDQHSLTRLYVYPYLDPKCM